MFCLNICHFFNFYFWKFLETIRILTFILACKFYDNDVHYYLNRDKFIGVFVYIDIKISEKIRIIQKSIFKYKNIV